MTPAVTVVVVNFNGGAWIVRCLAALYAQTYTSVAILVVDNASTDGSREQIIQQFPAVRLIAAGTNPGFAGGVNRALEEVATEWLALLNPDALAEPDWLAELMRAADGHPEAAAFGSQMLVLDDPARLDGMGDVYHASGLVWRRGHGRMKQPQDDVPREIFSPCAAAALYRSAAVRAVGGMDAALFCYLEDVDLGFRLRLAGYRCRYVPTARVLHAGSAIVGKHSDFQTYHGHRNLVRVFVKNMPGALFWMLLPLHLAMNVVSLVGLTLAGRGRAVWRAKRDALRDLPAAWQARQKVQALRRSGHTGLLALAREFAWGLFRR